MSLIEDIRKDREAGTPGLWRAEYEEDCSCPWGVVTDDNSEFWVASAHENIGNENAPEANARRIARVPTMEDRILSDAKKLLAAEELAEAYAQYRERPAMDNPDDWLRMDNAFTAYREATKS